MGFNYGLEKKKFDAEWVKLRAEYLAAGMSEEAIQKIYEYDLGVFNRQRADVNHEQPLVCLRFAEEEDLDLSQSSLYKKFFYELCCMDEYFAEGRFGWIESIKNEELYRKIKKLRSKDIELITLWAIEGYSITDIAKIQGKAISTVWENIEKLKQFLKKTEK